MDDSGEDEDEIVDVEEVEDDEGFLNIESANFRHDEHEEEQIEDQDNNNKVQNSDNDEENVENEHEGEEQSESEDESDSESLEDHFSEEEQLSDQENGGFTIDNAERHFEFDLHSADAHISHLRDSMQQPTQYDDNFEMNMTHYLDPSHIMPNFEVVHLPATIPTSNESQEPNKIQENKPKRGRPAKSQLLAQAEQVFRESLKNLSNNERDILNFLRFVDQFLSATYGVSIFEVKRVANHVGSRLESEGFIPRKKLPKRTMNLTSILQNPESPLVRLNLREIINYKTFNLLEPHEKDSLLKYLPNVDKTSKEAVESMFNSPSFLSNLPTFQEMLAMGEFDNNKDEYLQYVKGKKKRETTDAWKEKYYEEYWGQKLKNKEQTPVEPTPTFSFVEWSKQHAEEASSFPTHDFLHHMQEEELAQLEDEPVRHVIGRRGRKKEVKDAEELEIDPTETKPVIKKESDDNDNFVADEEDEEDEDGNPKKRKREKKSDKNYSPIGKKRERSSTGNSFKNCAQEILQREQRPLSASEIIKIALKEGLITTTGKTPQNTLASVIYCEMKKDPNCPFTKVGPMTFGLKEFKYDQVLDDEGKPKKKKKKKGTS